jgi:protein-S-isoprenylcysteine O-methyltransferase Ste14
VYVPWLILALTNDTLDFSGPRVLGAVPLVAGVAAMLFCSAGFVVEGRGTPALFDPPRRLVTGSLYERVRNPMYVGVIAALLGEAIVFGSIALVAWAVAVGLMFHLVVVRYEEPGLRVRFDGAYDDYARRVPRWIPRI